MSEKLAAINHVTSKMDARQRAALCWQEMSMGNIARPANADEAVKYMTPHFERAMADAKERVKLPKTRHGLTLHFTIFAKESDDEDAPVVELDGYVTTGVYEEDGRLGEFFVRVAKELAAMGPSLDAWAKAFSCGLQHGVPFELLCGMEIGTRFPPAGAVKGVEGILRCTSPTDLISRWLWKQYGPKDGRFGVEVQP